jgi:PIN domain nuclease of toxin-antitoxin system
VKILLDTHVLFWALIEQERLSEKARNTIKAAENEVLVSVASLWKMAIKVGLGKWPEARTLVDHFEIEVAAAKFQISPIAIAHVRAAGLLQTTHRDPFDRLLASQATIDGLTLVSADAKMIGLGADLLW